MLQSPVTMLPALEDLAVAPEHFAELKECESIFLGSERVDAEQVFVKGAAVARAKKVIPDDDTFVRWFEGRCAQVRRTAFYCLSVHEKLGAHKSLLVEHNVHRTAMYALAQAPTEKLEAVLERLRAGERPAAAEIRAFCKDGSAKATLQEPATVPGEDGVKALNRVKAAAVAPTLIDRLCAIIEAVQASLVGHKAGKSVTKGKLADKIEREARQARTELISLTGSIESNLTGAIWRSETLPFPAGSGWHKVAAMLLVLGGREDWPKDTALGTWLQEEVEPSLCWAIGSKRLARMSKPEKAVVVKLGKPAPKPSKKAKAGSGKGKAGAAGVKRTREHWSERRPAPQTAIINGVELPLRSVKDMRFTQHDVTPYLTGGDDKLEDLVARARADEAAAGVEPILVDFHGWPLADEPAAPKRKRKASPKVEPMQSGVDQVGTAGDRQGGSQAKVQNPTEPAERARSHAEAIMSGIDAAEHRRRTRDLKAAPLEVRVKDPVLPGKGKPVGNSRGATRNDIAAG